ncbi:Ku protein [Arthrobacter sp. zg-ZUI100]|uniref:non-homologous end joining protein Ku n=1 Tax=Arthrobacter jiangjiafuii TaxID=2817475 RepID=UPI001AEDF591|nr:Ku protein [Arthrobacter jiangjiafuii]MBP3035717.1 Ku protein [Arthrobacter jiangjiafuii]
MRAIWKGSIAFGLVNVPVKVYAATEDHDVSLHQVHEKDGGRIRYQRRCEVCGEVVEYKDIAKAYDDGEQTVVLTDEDLASLPVEKSREIEVVEFVPSEQVDPILLNRTYYLEPDSSSSKSYVLLRRTLEDTERTAIVQFSLRQKSRLGALRVRDNVLTLQTLLWEDEVREASFPSLDEKVRISSKELEMSSALVDSFSSDFNPAEFTDDYQEQLKTLIEAKLEKGESLDTEETFGAEAEEEGGKVLDLMEALRRSVEKNRDKKSGGSKSGSGGAKSSGAKGKDSATAEKKPAARKTAAKTRKGA